MHARGTIHEPEPVTITHDLKRALLLGKCRNRFFGTYCSVVCLVLGCRCQKCHLPLQWTHFSRSTTLALRSFAQFPSFSISNFVGIANCCPTSEFSPSKLILTTYFLTLYFDPAKLLGRRSTSISNYLFTLYYSLRLKSCIKFERIWDPFLHKKCFSILQKSVISQSPPPPLTKKNRLDGTYLPTSAVSECWGW